MRQAGCCWSGTPGHDDGWGVLGGAVDVGESPASAAVREACEEISADVQLVRLVDALGGPDCHVSYPNGDRTAYVTAVYEARIIRGSQAPGDGELSEFAWFHTRRTARPTAEPVLPRPPSRHRPSLTHSPPSPIELPDGGSISSAERSERGMCGRSSSRAVMNKYSDRAADMLSPSPSTRSPASRESQITVRRIA
jgi:ADP-ribose pyrophosphatase YjhB (NUDIX family)